MTYPATYPSGLYADSMGGVRAWLKAHPYLASINGRVFFRIPVDPVYPLFRIARVGGGPQAGEAPVEDVMVGIDLWGGSYSEISALAAAVKSACHLLSPGTVMGTCVGLNADVIGDIDAPDPDTGKPRKVLTVLFTVRPVTA